MRPPAPLALAAGIAFGAPPQAVAPLPFVSRSSATTWPLAGLQRSPAARKHGSLCRKKVGRQWALRQAGLLVASGGQTSDEIRANCFTARLLLHRPRRARSAHAQLAVIAARRSGAWARAPSGSASPRAGCVRIPRSARPARSRRRSRADHDARLAAGARLPPFGVWGSSTSSPRRRAVVKTALACSGLTTRPT